MREVRVALLEADVALPVARSFVDKVTEAAVGQQVIRRSEEHTSELQSLMRISYAVFCLKKKREQTPEIYYRHEPHQATLKQLTNNYVSSTKEITKKRTRE